MAKYIDKSALVAEIERRIESCAKQREGMLNVQCYTLADDASARMGELNCIQDFLGTLEVKEIGVDLEEKATHNTLKLSSLERIGKNWKEEPVSEELEEAAWMYYDKNKPLLPPEFALQREFVTFFEAGARWQEKKDQSTIELAEDHAMLAGMNKMEQQMMEKAIDGDVTFDYYGDDDKTYGCIAHDSFCLEDFGLKDRDKVKVIVIK